MSPGPRFIALTFWLLNLFILDQWRIWLTEPITEDAQTTQKLAVDNNAVLSMFFSLLSLLMFKQSFLSLYISLLITFLFSLSVSSLSLPFIFIFLLGSHTPSRWDR